MKPNTEDKIETFAIETLKSIGWEYIHGLAIAPSAEQAEPKSFEQIILGGRLRRAGTILNPYLPHGLNPVSLSIVSIRPGTNCS